MIRGSVTFCDDLRFEQNGKLFLIGVYGMDLVLGSDYPTKLAQLVVFVKVRAALEHAGKLLKLKIFLPGDQENPGVTHEMTLPERPSDEYITTIPSPYPSSPIFINFGWPITLSNIEIRERSFIRVVVECDNIEEKLDTLRISTSALPQPGQIKNS